MAPRQAKKLMVLLGCAGIWRVQNRQLFSPTYRGKSKCVLPFHTSYDGEETWDYYESILWLAKMVKAIVADVMLVYLPAPTVGLKPPLARNASAIAKFFSSCPDNAFQIALAGRSFTLVQRLGAFVRNAIKLLAVGTTASFIGTSFTNTVLKAKAAVNKDLEDEVVEIPVLQTSVAYGVYMSISSNLRYQLLAGVIEQRMLEPLLHNQKLLLSVMSFIVRTGNTFLGSLLWIDYARWIGIQKAHDHEEA